MKTFLLLRFAATTLAAVLSIGFGTVRAAAADAAVSAPPEPPTIPVVRAELQTSPDVLPFTGRIEAAQRVELRPRVSGPITAIDFEEGAVVTAGATLFTIDSRPYRARRDQAAAQLSRAEAESTLAYQELIRTRELRTSDAVSVEELERRTAAANAAMADVFAARAVLAAAELALEFTDLRAPIAGRVGRALLTVGNLATADATLLTTLVSHDVMRARFSVDEATYQRLRGAAGSTVKANLTVPGQAREFEATIDYLGNRIDAETGTAEVRATIDRAADLLADGMFARVNLQLPATVASVLVPEVALGAEQGSRYVLVSDATGKLAQRRVTLGQRFGTQRAIVSGVAPGEMVVVGGLQFLRPGMTIRPLTPPVAKSAPLASALK